MATEDKRDHSDTASANPPPLLCRVIAEHMDAHLLGRAPSLAELQERYPEYAKELAEFLSAHADLSSELNVAESSAIDTRPRLEMLRPGDSFAEYRIIRSVGRGGMGIVYEAYDSKLDRRIALKLISPELLPDQTAMDRFQREAKLTSRIDHSGICTVYDTGVRDGVPYIAMRFVDGETLTGTIARRKAEGGHPITDTRGDILNTATLFEKAARALHVTHEAGVIHRDIKPGNIMVTDGGDPVILDFGLAREVEAGLLTLTKSGDVLGTPAYMSPEQIQPRGATIDRRTDVYSLGATLYECLTLHRPFEEPSRAALFQAILKEEPADCRSYNPEIPKDLKVVLETALERDSKRRYRTAEALAEDLRRFCRGEPVHARPASATLRLRRWTGRHPFVVTTFLTVLLLLVTGLSISLIFLRRLNKEIVNVTIEKTAKEKALAANEELLRRSEGQRFLAQSRTVLDENPGLALLLAIEGAKRVPKPMAGTALLNAMSSLREERTLVGRSAVFNHDGRRVLTRTDEMVKIWDAQTGKAIHTVLGQWARFGPRGKRLIVWRPPDEIVVLDAETFEKRFAVEGNYGRFNYDGTRLVAINRLTEAPTNAADVWDVETGRRLFQLAGHSAPIRFAKCSGKENLLVTTSSDKTVRFWDLDQGVETLVLNLERGQVVLYAEWNPNGQIVAILTSDLGVARNSAVYLWDAKSSKQIFELKIKDSSFGNAHPEGLDRSVTFSPDGRRLILNWAGRIRIWDVASKTELKTFEGFGSASSPDGSLLAIGSKSGGVEIHDLKSETQSTVLHGHRKTVHSMNFTPDSTRLLTAAMDGTARIWRIGGGGDSFTLTEIKGHGPSAYFSPGGKYVVTGSSGNPRRIWDFATRNEILSVQKGASCTFSADDRRLLTMAWREKVLRILDMPSGRPLAEVAAYRCDTRGFRRDGTSVLFVTTDRKAVKRLDLRTGKRETLLEDADFFFGALLCLKGKRIVTQKRPATIQIWDSTARKELFISSLNSRSPVMIKAEGAWALIPFREGRTHHLKVVDARTGKEALSLVDHAHPILNSDGTRLLTVSRSKGPSETQIDTYHMWSLPEGRELFQLDGYGMMPGRFSPDDTMVVVRHREGSLKICDALTGEEIRSVTGHDAYFSPGGDKMVALHRKDKSCIVWDSERWKRLLSLSDLSFAEPSPDGRWLAVTSNSGAIRIVPLNPVNAALNRKPRELTPDEVDVYEIGRPDERDRYRLRWEINRRLGKLEVCAEAVAADSEDTYAREVFDRTIGEISKVLSSARPQTSELTETIERITEIAKKAGVAHLLKELLSQYEEIAKRRGTTR